MKNGERNNKPELIFSIKYMMIEIKKLSNTHTKEMIKKNRKKQIRLRLKGVYVNMRPNNKEEDNNNGKEVNKNKRNFQNKLQQNKKEEE